MVRSSPSLLLTTSLAALYRFPVQQPNFLQAFAFLSEYHHRVSCKNLPKPLDPQDCLSRLPCNLSPWPYCISPSYSVEHLTMTWFQSRKILQEQLQHRGSDSSRNSLLHSLQILPVLAES